MKLYLHIGTEKTGSSFLQSLCASSRENLANKGFVMPRDVVQEKRMLNGQISGGNGINFKNLCQQKDKSGIVKHLESEIIKAKRRNAHSLLISNENIINELDENGINILNSAVRELNIESTKILLFVRDPVEHAISLYKHRNKTGLHKSINEWLDTHYDTFESVKNFLELTEKEPFTINIKKYRKDGDYLKKIFFDEWLGVSMQADNLAEKVNVSLTFSEIHFLQNLQEAGLGKHVSFISERLQKIQKDRKAQSSEAQEKYYESIVNKWFKNKKQIISRINEYMPDNNKLCFPDYMDFIKHDSDSNYLSLSKYQVEEITNYLKFSDTYRGRFRIWLRKNSNLLPKFVRRNYKYIRKRYM